MVQVCHQEIVSGQWVPLQGCHWVLFICSLKTLRSQNVLLMFTTYSINRKLFQSASKIIVSLMLSTVCLQSETPEGIDDV